MAAGPHLPRSFNEDSAEIMTEAPLKPSPDIKAPNSRDPKALRACCGQFATGVTVVTTRTEEGDHGMTVSAFMSVSLDPPLIGVCVGARSTLLARVRHAGRFAVSVLAQDMEAHAMHFAGRRNDTLQDLFEPCDGLPVLKGAGAVFTTDLVQQVTTGDHVILIGQVCSMAHDKAARPLLHHAGQFKSIASPDSCSPERQHRA